MTKSAARGRPSPANGGSARSSAKQTIHPPKQRVFAALRQIVRAIDRYSRSLVTHCEVTGPQLVCLHVMQEEGPITSRALADKVHLDPSTLVGIIDRLQGRGFVERQRDTRDRRAVFLSLTETGLRFVREAPSPLQATLAKKLERLPEPKQLRLADALEQVVGLMQAEELPATPIVTFPQVRNRRSRAAKK